MRGIALLALMLLAGCQKSFDDRYADAEKKVREQVKSIDEDLAAKASEAAMGEGVVVSSDPPLEGEGDRRAQPGGGGVSPPR